MFRPSLGDDQASDGSLVAAQIQVNNIARAVMGVRRAERVPVQRLLESTGLPSLNRTVIQGVMRDTWKLHYSRDTPDGPNRHLLKHVTRCRHGRSEAAGLVRLPQPKRGPSFLYTGGRFGTLTKICVEPLAFAGLN